MWAHPPPPLKGVMHMGHPTPPRGGSVYLGKFLVSTERAILTHTNICQKMQRVYAPHCNFSGLTARLVCGGILTFLVRMSSHAIPRVKIPLVTAVWKFTRNAMVSLKVSPDRYFPRYTRRHIFLILVKPTEIRLHLPFYD